MRLNCYRALLSILFFHLFLVNCSTAQNKSEIPKVLFDCHTYSCDFDFIRTEIKWVDFVRDQSDANIYILITSQFINGGGEKVYLYFTGKKIFQNISDTLSYLNDGNSTQDEKRKLMLQYTKLGLMTYISKTTLSKNFDIHYKMSDSDKEKNTDSSQSKNDPWNQWVFSIGVNGNINGSEVYKSSSLGGHFSANRTTEKIKTSFIVDYSSRISESTYGTEVIKVESKNQNINFENVFSISKHWSWGFDVGYNKSLFSNLKSSYSFYPKIEYNIYPYSISNTKLITFAYFIGPEYNVYYDTTIFFKTKESLFKQRLTATSSFTQPWGTVNGGIFYSNYLHDFTKNNLSIFGVANIRIFKGLSVNLFGSYSLTHDQISLPKGNATRDDVITQRRLIFSGYNYYTSVGLQYRFGSKYNNVVNPRFSGLNFFF